MGQCHRVDACALKETVRVETRAKALPVLLQGDEFVAGHDASGAAEEWASNQHPTSPGEVLGRGVL